MTAAYPGSSKQPALFASTFTYAYTKLRGQAWVEKCLREGEGFPAAETLRNLTRATEGEIRLYQSGNTLISHARSRAAGEFLRSGADVWVSFDDDALVTAPALHALIESAREQKALVGLPVVARSGRVLGYTKDGPWDASRIVTTREGEKLYPTKGVGWSAVAVSLGVVEKLANASDCAWVTLGEEGKDFPALFREVVREGWWVGEDYYFSLQCERAGLPRFILLELSVTHAGVSSRVRIDGSHELDAKSAAALGNVSLAGD